MKFSHIALATAVAVFASAAQAKPIWQDVSVTGLYGNHYALIGSNGTTKDSQVTGTFEYAAKMPYVDVFAFADRTHNDINGSDTYFEFSPRLSLSETFKTPLKAGIVKDVLISTTWEASETTNNFLYGVGVDLDLPKFQYASLNFYRANNGATQDDWQVTATYGVPFQLAQEEFLVDGFLDWSTKEKDHASEMNWTSQVKWNIGKHISPETRLYLGVEYSHWNNKYGISNFDERNVSGLVKYHF